MRVFVFWLQAFWKTVPCPFFIWIGTLFWSGLVFFNETVGLFGFRHFGRRFHINLQAFLKQNCCFNESVDFFGFRHFGRRFCAIFSYEFVSFFEAELFFQWECLFFWLQVGLHYFAKPQRLGTGILQNTDELFVMAKIIEALGLDNANSFFQIWSPIPILPLIGDASSFLTLWTLWFTLLGGNSLPIGRPPQILLRGARTLDKIVRNLIPCHPGFEISENFAISSATFPLLETAGRL